MASKGAILGVLGILLGLGGIGFGIINWINISTLPLEPTSPDEPSLPVEPQWYNYYETEFSPNPALVYLPIPNISIVVELTESMSLRLLFTCSARCLGDAASFSDLLFYFMIDNIRQTDMPWTRVGSYESNTNYEYYSVSLQHYIDILPSGVYNFTVAVLTERLGNFIRQSSLWIESHSV